MLSQLMKVYTPMLKNCSSEITVIPIFLPTKEETVEIKCVFDSGELNDNTFNLVEVLTTLKSTYDEFMKVVDVTEVFN